MKEKDDNDMDELIYSSPFINQNKHQKSSKIKINPDKGSIFTIVIRLPSHKAFSFEVPQAWTTKKLISFIKSTFKQEFKNLNPIFIYHGNTLSPISESPLKDYFQPDKINIIIISLKKLNHENKDENAKNDLLFKQNKEIFKSEEFIEMEKNVLDDYIKIFKNNSINNFPFMNPAYNHRREQITSNSTLDRLAAYEPIPLEDFPFRNYFQLNIIFKCFISFFAFGIYTKGINFILFLFVLIGYYWYCINNVIEEFYKKKIQEIGLSEEDYRRIKNGGIFRINGTSNAKKIFIINNNEEESEENKDNKKEKENEIKINTNVSSNINREANNIKNDVEEDLKEEKEDKKDVEEKKEFNPGKESIINNLIFNKEDNKDINDENKKDDEKAPLLNNLNDILTGNNLRGQNNNNINNNTFNINRNKNLFNNNNIINNNVENKEEKKDEKKEEIQQEVRQEEVRRESAFEIIWEIIRVFFISFIPALCDEFEANNPIPINNNNDEGNDDNNNNNNDNNNNNNNINDNNNNNNNNIFNNDFNNMNNNINNINNDINNNENIDNKQGQTDSIQEEDSNNNKMTSSKVVNMSDDSSRDNRMFKLIKRDNQSTNENEYVFSENGGIDNLSMNSELFKQKREKEKEKEKEK